MMLVENLTADAGMALGYALGLLLFFVIVGPFFHGR